MATILKVLHVVFREVTTIGEQGLGHLRPAIQHSFDHRHKILLVRGLVAHPVRDDPLMGIIHDDLCVVGLDVPPRP
jgi:hypothetical protein